MLLTCFNLKKYNNYKLLRSQNAFNTLWQYNKRISVQYGQLSHSWSISRIKKANSHCYNPWSQIKLPTDSTLLKYAMTLLFATLDIFMYYTTNTVNFTTQSSFPKKPFFTSIIAASTATKWAWKILLLNFDWFTKSFCILFIYSANVYLLRLMFFEYLYPLRKGNFCCYNYVLPNKLTVACNSCDHYKTWFNPWLILSFFSLLFKCATLIFYFTFCSSRCLRFQHCWVYNFKL